MKLKWLLFLAMTFLFTGQLHAQNTANLSSGAANDAACTASSCLTVQVGAAGSASFSLAGTWAGTQTFEVSGDDGGSYSTLLVTPSNSATAVTTTTGNGVFQANAAAYSYVRIRFSTYSSGTAAVKINTSTASARTNGGGASSGGTVTGVLGTAPIASDGSPTTPTLSCSPCLVSGGALGTPASGTATNLTGLPIAGITGLGTGVGTALAANVSGSGAICLASGSACAGAAGTPTDLGTLTYNASGTTTFAAASNPWAGGAVTATHSTSSTLSPTNLVKWGNYMLEIKQDGTGGGVTLTLGTGGTCSAWKVGGAGAGAIVLSTSANAIDMLTFTYDGSSCLANFRNQFN